MHSKTSRLIGLFAAATFIALMLLVKAHYLNQAIPELDSSLISLAIHLQNNSLAVTISGYFAAFLGDTTGAIVGLAAFLALFFLFGERAGALWLAVVAVIAVGLNTGIKSVIGRARPTDYRLAQYAHESGKSFASGHTVFATVLFGCLFLILIQHVHNFLGRFVAGLLSLALIIATALSRVIVGVHYPSDTMGGFLLALAIICLTYPSYYRRLHPHKNAHQR